MGGEQDMRSMGGLKPHLPATYWTFLIGTLAISGFPFLSGFFSKDAILAAEYESNIVLWALGLLTAGLTAFYMFRLFFLTFHGSFRGTEDQRKHLHESPLSMVLPLAVLALGSAFAGYLGKIPFTHTDLFGHFLAPVIYDLDGASHHVAHHGLVEEALLVGASVLIALLGIALAWSIFGRERGLSGGEFWKERLGKAHHLLVNKYFVDEIYDRLIVRPLAFVARMCWKAVDTLLIDGSIHVMAFVTELTGDLGRFSTTGNVRNYALYFFGGMVLLFCWMVL
jgi:NADH-quinone oxidoreductase subunit L